MDNRGNLAADARGIASTCDRVAQERDFRKGSGSSSKTATGLILGKARADVRGEGETI